MADLDSPQPLEHQHTELKEGSCACGQLKITMSGVPVRTSICHCYACQVYIEILSYYLSYKEYSEILKAYHIGIEKFQADSINIQKSHYENVKSSYSNLSNATKAVSDSIMEEIKGLESGLQLDINLEKKKSGEAFKSIIESGKSVNTYMKSKLEAVQNDLKAVDKHAKMAIIGKINVCSLWPYFTFLSFRPLGFMCLLVGSFTGYTVFVSQ